MKSIAEEKYVIIKGVKEEVITVDGIRVYKNRFCKCGCGDRIIVSKWHNQNGMPRYITGHNPGIRHYDFVQS